MSILKFLWGPPPEKIETKGDGLFDSGLWGDAKLEYERALAKAQKENRLSPEWEARLLEKIAGTKEALAADHQRTAEDLMEGGYYDEARTLLDLARDMTGDKVRTRALAALAEKLESLQRAEATAALAEDDFPIENQTPEEHPEGMAATLDEQFYALSGTLPPEIQKAYLTYGEDFRAGYLALNAGEFETAATLLSQAMAADSASGSYIPLELATAYLHLGRLTEAQQLLVPFLEHHPDALPAYQLLCDICWQGKNFQQADAVIDAVPETFADSLAVWLLRGETRFHAGDFNAAVDLYQTFLDQKGWREEIALALAKAHEASGGYENARLIYQEVMGRCTRCGAGIDPEIKHKYAELSFAAGIHDTKVLELYLRLAQDIPQMAPTYYDRVASIYAARGDESEAARFRAIARRLGG